MLGWREVGWVGGIYRPGRNKEAYDAELRRDTLAQGWVPGHMGVEGKGMRKPIGGLGKRRNVKVTQS